MLLLARGRRGALTMGRGSTNMAGVRWLGFDLDHTLVQYRLGPLFRLIYSALIDNIVTSSAGHLGYSRAEIFGEANTDAGADFDANAASLLVRGLVLDMEHGDFLKLDSDGCVRAARHGLQQPAQLGSAAIRRRYGTGPWRHYAGVKAGTRQPGLYRVFAENFDLPAVLLCARLVDLHDARRRKATAAAAAPPYPFGEDLNAAFELCYAPQQFARGVGGYFPAVRDEPYRYVVDRRTSALARWLRATSSAPDGGSGDEAAAASRRQEQQVGQRRRPLRLFLVTNSAPDYASFLMDTVFGADSGASTSCTRTLAVCGRHSVRPACMTTL